MAHPFFTIGHSTLAITDFVGLLKHAEVHLVVDVRTIARSRTNPQYNGDVLCEELSAFQIEYVHFASLGGLRGRAPDISGAVNAFWKNQSFHNYADYAMTDAFRTGFAELRERGHAQPCAVMCAEAVWWRCHRRIIADYLIAAGETVFHILPGGRIERAQRTPAAARGPVGTLFYPGDAVKRGKGSVAAHAARTAWTDALKSAARRPLVSHLNVEVPRRPQAGDGARVQFASLQSPKPYLQIREA